MTSLWTSREVVVELRNCVGNIMGNPKELELQWGWGRNQTWSYPLVCHERPWGCVGWMATDSRLSALTAQDGKRVAMPWGPGGQGHNLCVFWGMEVTGSKGEGVRGAM